MSSNPIKFKRGGEDRGGIDTVNQFLDALGGNVVPRNRNGIATDVAGDLGLPDVPFAANSHITKLFLGATADQVSMEESSGSLLFNVGGVELFRVTPNMRTYSQTPGRGGIGVETSGGYANTGTSYTTALTANLAVSGKRPVLIALGAEDTTTEGTIDAVWTGGGTSVVTCQIAVGIFRDATQIYAGYVGGTIDVDSVVGFRVKVPASSIWVEDFPPAAATYAYTLRLKRISATTTAQVNGDVTLFAMEV